MSWASNRKFTYLSGFFLFVGLILFFILYPIFHKDPTCFDGKKNGEETGLDCGGICQKMCPEDVSDPVVLWNRIFHVSYDSYNLLAYIENQNKNSAVVEVPYEFRVYDVDNKLIGRREGSTYIPPNQRFAIFEARFNAGEAIPKSVTFNFTGSFIWWKKNPTIQTLPIKVDRITTGDDLNSPTLNARVTNDSIYDLPEFEVITILYDKEGNAVNASKTYKKGLKSNNSLNLFFTWPNPFSGVPVVKDVLLQVNPFKTSF